MLHFLIIKFIKDNENVEDIKVRKAYGILSGVLGIICNIGLFIIKLITGILMNSIAIISDAFNNLSDTGSSLITIFGANFSSKPPDKEHPYGHGRFEYIAALIVSFIIFAVGLQLLNSSYKKIINPEPVDFSILSIGILTVTIIVKIWMYSYNKFIGKKINSSMNIATAKDSLMDAIATTGVIIGTIIGLYIDFPIDGILGLIISLLIIYTGFSTARETVHFLLGTSPDPKVIEQITAIVSQSKTITNCHDVNIHDYGPGRKIASMHVVVPANISVEEAHTFIYNLEKEIKTKLGIDIVIHMDPEENIDEELDGDHSS